MRAIKNLADGATENHGLHFALDVVYAPRVFVSKYTGRVYPGELPPLFLLPRYGFFDQFAGEFLFNEIVDVCLLIECIPNLEIVENGELASLNCVWKL